MYEFNKTWDISTTWTGMSGNMITLPLNGTKVVWWSGINFQIQEGTNNYRLPFYHRMDLNVTAHTCIGDFNMSVYNLYNRMNVAGITSGKKMVQTSEYDYEEVEIYNKVTLFPIIPSISYIWKF